MKTMVRFGACAAVALAAWAAPMVQAEMLTEAELAEGWIQLYDGETLFGWAVLGEGNWRVEDGNIVADEWSNGWIATKTAFTEFEVEVKLRVSATEEARGDAIAAVCVVPGLQTNVNSADNDAIVVTIKSDKGKEGEWRTVKLKYEGGKATMGIDDKEPRTIDAAIRPRHIGVITYGVQCKVEVASAKLRPLNLRPLFNGKDLTGWNIIPDHKSEFSVIDGALNIQNGNGQIETEEVFKDFVLQLDVIAYGNAKEPFKPLNSGVFFRTPPGVFWKGYESQLRNEWQNDDRTQPFDFGTGGLYAIQPARKVIPNEGDWFHKTIVAHGNHFATWVNGYQISDFTDMRAPAPAADGKVGYVDEAGTINLQGHDPTTNLSFKNININAYPAK